MNNKLMINRIGLMVSIIFSMVEVPCKAKNDIQEKLNTFVYQRNKKKNIPYVQDLKKNNSQLTHNTVN